jgi:hypothetical protein
MIHYVSNLLKINIVYTKSAQSSSSITGNLNGDTNKLFRKPYLQSELTWIYFSYKSKFINFHFMITDWYTNKESVNRTHNLRDIVDNHKIWPATLEIKITFIIFVIQLTNPERAMHFTYQNISYLTSNFYEHCISGQYGSLLAIKIILNFHDKDNQSIFSWLN